MPIAQCGHGLHHSPEDYSCVVAQGFAYLAEDPLDPAVSGGATIPSHCDASVALHWATTRFHATHWTDARPDRRVA